MSRRFRILEIGTFLRLFFIAYFFIFHLSLSTDRITLDFDLLKIARIFYVFFLFGARGERGDETILSKGGSKGEVDDSKSKRELIARGTRGSRGWNIGGRKNIAVSISVICCGGEKVVRDEKTWERGRGREEGVVREWNRRNEVKSER